MASYGQIYGEKGRSVSDRPLQTGNNSYAHTSLEKVDALNEFFFAISTTDDRNVPIPNFEKRIDAIFENLSINISEVMDILQF